MNKRLVYVIGGLLFLPILILISILVYDTNLKRQEDLMRPNDMGSYQNRGYFKIDPRTILVSLGKGDTNVFTPMLDDPQDVEALNDLSIYWTQEDFLKITSALGQTVWDDSMDQKDWGVYYIYFDGNCGDTIGLYSANITYFKKVSNQYITRLIEIEPYFGWVRWGEGANVRYTHPILRKWISVDLSGAKTTADDALRVVNEDVKAHYHIVDNVCSVMMSSSCYYTKNWHLKIFLGPVYPILYTVDLNTGEMIRKTK
jgi:hypothetical protein